MGLGDLVEAKIVKLMTDEEKQDGSHYNRFFNCFDFSPDLKLASGIIVDLKTILGDMRKGEAEFSEGVNPELRSTIEKAIGEQPMTFSVIKF